MASVGRLMKEDYEFAHRKIFSATRLRNDYPHKLVVGWYV